MSKGLKSVRRAVADTLTLGATAQRRMARDVRRENAQAEREMIAQEEEARRRREAQLRTLLQSGPSLFDVLGGASL